MACESDSPKTSRKRIAMCACSHACVEQCTIFKTLLSAARNTDSVWETCVWTHFWPLIIAQFLKVHNCLICEMGIIPRASQGWRGRESPGAHPPQPLSWVWWSRYSRRIESLPPAPFSWGWEGSRAHQKGPSSLSHAPVSAAQWLCLYKTLSPVVSFHLPPFPLLPHSTVSVCLQPPTPAQTLAHGCPYKEPYGRRNPSQPIKTSLTLSSKEQRKNKCQTSTAEGRIQPMLKDTNLHQEIT